MNDGLAKSPVPPTWREGMKGRGMEFLTFDEVVNGLKVNGDGNMIRHLHIKWQGKT
jgi:hypothetical protein